ncbi:MAG: AmmeMemoRadiSam system protein A [Polyangiales bacterium]
MSIPCAVLMCHAPIVIPQIAGSRARACARTTAAMAEAARRLVAHAPDAIVIISPHTPRDPLRFGIAHDETLSGDFGQFGCPELSVRLQGAPQIAATLREVAAARGLATTHARGQRLDHGALVPLFFVREAGWNGPTLLLALPFPDTRSETAMGRAIAETAAKLGKRVCVLASGDMSHRLTEDAPAGYHPAAREFDATFCDLVQSGSLTKASDIDPALREIAAEDVVDSFTVAASAVDFDPSGHTVLSYEGPFGVGYLEAVLYEQPAGKNLRGEPEHGHGETPPRALLGIARAAIAAHLEGRAYAPAPLLPPWTRSRGVFVTLRSRDGELRGCIGHIEPGHATLAHEVASCAVSSATRDTRFGPVDRNELDELEIELSLLSEPEPVPSLAQLDPSRFGVVVSSGSHRGVLLPGIAGIDSAREQVRIAATKAGLPAGAPVQLERFEVQKISENHALH